MSDKPKYEPLVTRATLIKALKTDDEGAWSDFYDRYASLILNFAMKRGCSRELAEDVLQEVVMSLVKYLKKIQYDRQKGSFKSLLFRITESKVVDAFRREGKLIKIKDSELFRKKSPAEKDAFEESESLFDKEWEASLLRGAIEEAKQQVQPATFSCFEEVFIKGKSIGETAEKMNMSKNLVSQHKFKVMKIIINTAKKILDAHKNYKREE